jgi:hypothetical protein
MGSLPPLPPPFFFFAVDAAAAAVLGGMYVYACDSGGGGGIWKKNGDGFDLFCSNTHDTYKISSVDTFIRIRRRHHFMGLKLYVPHTSFWWRENGSYALLPLSSF